MKPSVHLQQVGTGRRWVGRCTGEPQPGNFIRFGCGDFWMGSNGVLLDPPSLITLHYILRVIDTRLYFTGVGIRGEVKPGPLQIGEGHRQPYNWREVHPSDVLTFGSEVGLRILWVGEGESPFTPAYLAWNGGTVVKMASAIVAGDRFSDLPVLADALEEAACTCAAALACFRKGEKSITADYLLELLLGRLPPATVIDSRPMAHLPGDRDMPDPKANWFLAERSRPPSLSPLLGRTIELLRQGFSHEEIGVELGLNPKFIQRVARKLHRMTHPT